VNSDTRIIKPDLSSVICLSDRCFWQWLVLHEIKNGSNNCVWILRNIFESAVEAFLTFYVELQHSIETNFLFIINRSPDLYLLGQTEIANVLSVAIRLVFPVLFTVGMQPPFWLHDL
jgi:hypothetical protein